VYYEELFIDYYGSYWDPSSS